MVRGEYNQNGIKYIIGLCDFFIGSRMHSCVAALSQNIPTIGLAYSRKFEGVFETVGAGQFVVDLRRTATRDVLPVIVKAFEQREVTAQHLKLAVPEVQRKIWEVFADIT